MANVIDYIKRMKNGEFEKTPEEKRVSPIAKYIDSKKPASGYEPKRKVRERTWPTSEETE